MGLTIGMLILLTVTSVITLGSMWADQQVELEKAKSPEAQADKT